MGETKHSGKRMNQRGISKHMVELALTYGVPVQDKYVLNRKQAKQLLEEKRRETRELMKVIDKGGVTVVECDNAQLTAYNCTSYKRNKKARRNSAA